MRLVAFDLDGVIINSRETYVKAFCRAVDELGFSCERLDVEKLLGKPVSEVVSSLLPDDAGKIRAARQMVNQLVVSEDVLEKIVVSDSAKPCLAELASVPDINLCLVTNSGIDFTEAVLSHFGLKDYFAAVLTADDDSSKERRLLRLLEDFDSKPSKSFYVGDLVYDVGVARKAGMLSVAVYNPVSWVYPEKERIEAANPDYLIEDLSQLPAIVSRD
ncbi:MAG: HAD family hydrolase [Candidatus Altiarchaeota archaeon]